MITLLYVLITHTIFNLLFIYVYQWGETPLIIAASKGKIEALKVLLNSADSDGANKVRAIFAELS